MSNIDIINGIKANISKYEKEIDRYRNEFLVNKTKYNQYMEDRKALLDEMDQKGYTLDNLNELLVDCHKEMDEIESKIKELLYTDKFNIKADIEIEESNEVEFHEAKEIDFKEVDMTIPEIDLESSDTTIDWDKVSKSMN